MAYEDCYNQDKYYSCVKFIDMMKEKIKKAGILKRYENITFDKIKRDGIPNKISKQYDEVMEYKNNLNAHVKKGEGLILKGSVGTMKTTFAIALLVEWLRENNGFFVSMPSLLDDIFTYKAVSSNQWVDFENKIKKSTLLVIDDMGAEHTEGWVLTKVDSIISERYNRQLPTIITTNLTSDQLKKTYAERIIDRLKQTSTIINFNFDSLR